MEAGLQWGPADVQPLVLSPNWWTCMPRLALASWPVMFHEMVVGEDSEACSKVTVPVIFESPRMNATTQGADGQQGPAQSNATIRGTRVRCLRGTGLKGVHPGSFASWRETCSNPRDWPGARNSGVEKVARGRCLVRDVPALTILTLISSTWV
jgi:hypothetical protein